jgi:hypothetical protein
MTVYVGRKCDVSGILGERSQPIFQTMTKTGELTGWRYGNNLQAAKKSADEDGK